LIQQRIDTLIYGCTHYPLLAPVLRSLLPAGVTSIDPAVRVVAAAAKELELLGLRNAGTALPTRFCVSGQEQQFAQLSVQWLGCTPAVEKISLPTVVRSPVSLQSAE
jgi:glutamate racemase